MTYTVLARRYRSRDFNEVVGQSSVADTLRRAVEQDRTAHAYLFCGTRGVGKTTMARIFARAMNVSDDLEDAEAIAEAIMRGDDLDVIEIDGASNRGVQEARDLIAGAGLSPARCRYRIYIIDEVHMLTTESFNTLLKTMEEPPPHVKFILCTTEPHKVLPTIQSRCQRFEFKPIPHRVIVSHLTDIVKLEGVEVDEAALGRVAELGNGSMRDALSVMDRLMAGGDTRITLEDVETALGLPETAMIDAVVDAVSSGIPADAIGAGDALLASGASIDQALAALTETFRRILIVSACGPSSDVLDIPEDRRESLAEVASRFEAASLVHAIAVCESVAKQGRLGASARALYDAALVRLALAADLVDPASAPPAVRTGSHIEAKKKRSETPARQRPDVKKASAPPHQKAEPVADSPSTPGGSSGRQNDACSLEDVWRRAESAAGSAAAKAAFASVEPIRFEQDRVLVRSVDGALPAVIVQRLSDWLSTEAGRGVKVETESPEPASVPTRAASIDSEDHPRIELAQELFDATVVDVTPTEPPKEED